jgi:hypothetical protein
MVPLANGRGSEEPLLPVIAALADLAERELGVVQVLFEPTRVPWPDSVARAVTASGGGPFFADAPEITNLAREKLTSPLFAVALRVIASADLAERAWDIMCQIVGGVAPLGNPRTKELMPLHTEDLNVLEADLRQRTTYRSGRLLSADELVSLVQLPGAGVRMPELWRPRERAKRAPAEVTRGAGCFLGENEHHEQVVEVHLPDEAPAKHVHILGASGTGKSILLQQMILEDIEAGHGAGVLDPHGDLVDEIAAGLAAEGSESSSANVLTGELQALDLAFQPLIREAPRGSSGERKIRRPHRGPARSVEPPRSALAAPGVMATPDAAVYLGLSPATLETMRTRGGGPVFLKLGRRVLYRQADHDRWLHGRRRSSTSDSE